MYILGISAYYHDSAAALVHDGEIVAAAQEERFSRRKHDAEFPRQSIAYCLQEAGIELAEVTYVVFYDKPLIKFERLLETYLAFAPKGLTSFAASMPVWLKDKLFLKTTLKQELRELVGRKQNLPQLLFTEHHQSHAASAFFPSPFGTAAVICMDGVGEWATTSVWKGDGNKLELQWEIEFPHSLGLLYSAFTYYTGFKVNSGEYKLMGLAPYGEPKYADLIKERLVDIKSDGTFRLNMDYFEFATGLKMTNSKFDLLFGGPARKPESEVTQKEMDLASSIQKVTEEIVLRLAETVYQELGCDNLCLAGGVALNCVANGRLLRESSFEDMWIQPAAGDAGGSIGAALSCYYEFLNRPRPTPLAKVDAMKGAYLGPEYNEDAAVKFFDKVGASYQAYDEAAMIDVVADILASENVVGWFQGRMEFGPRSLGCRSIIGDPRSEQMQSVMNQKIKYRESFRPFAPAVLEEDVAEYFDIDVKSPYMLLVALVNQRLRKEMTVDQKNLFGIDKLKVPRSDIPSITHVDYSARVQTVCHTTNPKFHSLLTAFKKKTECSVLINTSFNVRGEPIVCTVEDAYRCFMRTEIDYLVVGNLVLSKANQPKWRENKDWRAEFVLD